MKNILYTKNFNKKIKEDVNIILSPEFYWIKKVEIPIKSLKEAQLMAPNQFKLEGDYFYSAVKIEDTYFIIAIPKNMELNIEDKYIKSIHIVQTEFFEFECIKIDENHCLKKINDILFYLPCKDDVNSCKQITEIIDNIKLSKYNFNFKNIVPLNLNIILFLSFLFIISMLFIGIAFKYNNLTKNLDFKKKELITKNNLPPTTFQIDSILNNLETIDKEQVKLRKDLEFFSHLSLSQDEKFLLLSKTNKGYYLIIKTNKSFDNILSKKFLIINSSLSNGEYKAELNEK